MDGPASDDRLIEPFRGITPEIISGAVSGAVTDGLLGGFIGALAPVAARAVGLAQGELMNGSLRRQMVLQVALAEAGDADAALSAAEADPDLVFLMHAAGDAAEHTRSLKKLVFLGEALAAGLLAKEREMIDHQVMLVQAMDAIERPHLTLLAEMVDVEGDGPMSILRPQDRNWDQLRATAGASRPALVKILADLETAGLILRETYIIDGGDLGADNGAKESPLGNRRWEASEFGLDLLARFRGIGIRAGQAPAEALSY
jgi:DNA-binding Lrp family transcriptional regulator